MKLTKLAGGGLTQTRDVPGLLTCRLDYEIKSGTGRLDYTGPKFDPAMWHQVLSFFRWTHQEMNSESQVRLYVNTRLGRWGAWAFPQEARTGMNAREIATPETPEQAVARFASWGAAPSADWLYFATVHHHCSASAFQSGTDEENERHQDGLHLTVGRLEAERHELHARFYLGGNCFAPDLSRFWPVDEALAARVPPMMRDELARFEMGDKVVVDFPDAWRRNVIEVKPPARLRTAAPEAGTGEPRLEHPDWVRAVEALRDLSARGAMEGFAEDDLFGALHSLATHPAHSLILETCLRHQVRPDDLLEEMESYELPYGPGY
jgi:hypothetical protein